MLNECNPKYLRSLIFLSLKYLLFIFVSLNALHVSQMVPKDF